MFRHNISPAVAPVRAAGGIRGHFLSIIPFDGHITEHTVDSLLNGFNEPERLWRGWKFHSGEGQGRSRNQCAHVFLKDTDCAFHDLYDADIRWQPRHVRMLREHPRAHDSIICAAIPKRQAKVEFALNTLKDGPHQPDATGSLEVAKASTAFMQIPRSAYERFAEAYPDLRYRCDYEKGPDGLGLWKTGFFCERVMIDEDVGYARHLTEDWMFCYLMRRIGIKIFVDMRTADAPWILHRGHSLFPLPTELERQRLEDELEKAQARIAELEAKA